VLRQSTKRKPQYFLAGNTAHLLIELYVKGVVDDLSDVMEATAKCFLFASNEDDYDCTPDDRDNIVNRCSEFFVNFRRWWRSSGFTPLAVEAEIRHPSIGGSPEIAGKIDLLAERNGEFYALDWKTHGMWGKSISVPKVNMARELQPSLYAMMIKNGTFHMGGGVGRLDSNEEASMKTSEVKLGITPDHIGFVEVAYLTKYIRGSKDGSKKAGDLRGDPLFTTPFTEAKEEHAIEVIKYITMCIENDSFPRFAGRQCDTCEFNKACWSDDIVQYDLPKFARRFVDE